MIDDVSAVSPALAHYQDTMLLNGLWLRPGLAQRDRAIVTLATLISRNHTGLLPFYFTYALDHGVSAKELSEIITHLAFYAGWGNAAAAVAAAQPVFAQRGIGPDELAPVEPTLLPLDQASESRRAATVEQSVGRASAGLIKDTGDVLFHDLWLRPDLAPRDRSMVTVAALIANGQVQQIGFHLNRAMDNGLTTAEVGELVSQIAYYAGWPSAFSAVPIVKSILEERAS